MPLYKSVYLQISQTRRPPLACHFIPERSSTHNEAPFHLTNLKQAFKRERCPSLRATLALSVAVFRRTIGNYVQARGKKKVF